MQPIHPKANASDKKQAIYNLFAAYIQTMALEKLIDSFERALKDAQPTYLAIYGQR